MQIVEALSRRQEILKASTGLDYASFSRGNYGFAYEELMNSVGYSLAEIVKLQAELGVGNTPLVELKNLTQLVRKSAKKGKGARIFLKDEAANPSGSYKDRRASVAVFQAKVKGYPGIVAATSGNYGAAVACQGAKRGLDVIVIQETFDSNQLGQPEILEKGRACAGLGAEVLQLTVGPELFAMCLFTLESTGFFNGSLYTPYAVVGVETLGYEIAEQMKKQEGRYPDMVVCTHAGGGNLAGTARGLKNAGATSTEIVGVSVNLAGLHMASDKDFNRKSFTTGHTGFGIPFATWPDRSDVLYNAARPLRYMDSYYTVTQGEVFFITEALAKIEGMERGPAGNTSLAAAVVLAKELDQDQILVVQETEYTGAGKHPTAQLELARNLGVRVIQGDRSHDAPGSVIAIPKSMEELGVTPLLLDKLRRSYLKNALQGKDAPVLPEDVRFFAQDLKCEESFIQKTVEELKKGE